MDDVFLARIRLEGSRGSPNALFSVLERVRGRSLLELLLATPIADVTKTAEFRAAERRIAVLQLRLMRAKGRHDRQLLLDQIFVAEEQLAPLSTELFKRTRTAPHKPSTLRDLQRALRTDEVLLEFALAEPNSYAIVATRSAARVHRFAGRNAFNEALEPLMKGIRGGADVRKEAGAVLLNRIPEIAASKRIIVSADGAVHQLPFEVLITESGKSLLDSHIVSYVPSASVLVFLRNRQKQNAPLKAALAVSASPTPPKTVPSSTGAAAPVGAISRGVYDLDATQLPALPSANDEARFVGAMFGPTSTVFARRLGDRTGTEEAAASGLCGASFCGAWNRQYEVPGALGAGSPGWWGRRWSLSSAGNPVDKLGGGAGNALGVRHGIGHHPRPRGSCEPSASIRRCRRENRGSESVDSGGSIQSRSDGRILSPARDGSGHRRSDAAREIEDARAVWSRSCSETVERRTCEWRQCRHRHATTGRNPMWSS